MNATKNNPKDFFINLSAFICLYILVGTFLFYVFSVIDYVFQDRQNLYVDPYSSGIRLAISVLVIGFPLLFYFVRKIQLDILSMPEKRDYAFRKWLTYLTLVLTGATLAIDAIVVLNTFLGGEISERFILKVISVLVVAGGVFWFYLADLRGVFAADTKALKITAYAAIGIFLVSLVGGFYIIGSPSTQRALRDDSRRVMDLQSIEWQVKNYYQTNGALPATLSSLNDPLGGFSVPTDPSTGANYAYKVIAATSSASSAATSSRLEPMFELCAIFSKEDMGGNAALGMYPAGMPVMPNGRSDDWDHARGLVCFDRAIDPALYPVNK